MPQGVRAELLVDPRRLEPVIEPPGHLALRQPRIAVGQEQRPAFTVAAAAALLQAGPQEGAQRGL